MIKRESVIPCPSDDDAKGLHPESACTGAALIPPPARWQSDLYTGPASLGRTALRGSSTCRSGFNVAPSVGAPRVRPGTVLPQLSWGFYKVLLLTAV